MRTDLWEGSGKGRHIESKLSMLMSMSTYLHNGDFQMQLPKVMRIDSTHAYDLKGCREEEKGRHAVDKMRDSKTIKQMIYVHSKAGYSGYRGPSLS